MKKVFTVIFGLSLIFNAFTVQSQQFVLDRSKAIESFEFHDWVALFMDAGLNTNILAYELMAYRVLDNNTFIIIPSINYGECEYCQYHLYLLYIDSTTKEILAKTKIDNMIIESEEEGIKASSVVIDPPTTIQVTKDEGLPDFSIKIFYNNEDDYHLIQKSYLSLISLKPVYSNQVGASDVINQDVNDDGAGQKPKIRFTVPLKNVLLSSSNLKLKEDQSGSFEEINFRWDISSKCFSGFYDLFFFKTIIKSTLADNIETKCETKDLNPIIFQYVDGQYQKVNP